MVETSEPICSSTGWLPKTQIQAVRSYFTKMEILVSTTVETELFIISWKTVYRSSSLSLLHSSHIHSLLLFAQSFSASVASSTRSAILTVDSVAISQVSSWIDLPLSQCPDFWFLLASSCSETYPSKYLLFNATYLKHSRSLLNSNSNKRFKNNWLAQTETNIICEIICHF